MKKDELPLVSIGVPTFNRPEGLRRTLTCITQQTYSNLDIIVSNNSPTDEKPEQIVEEFKERGHRIRYFKQDQNRGPFVNLRFLLSKAEGRYFMWAADDDYFESPNLVEQLVKADDKNTLLFPEYHLASSPDHILQSVYQDVYGRCESESDYLLAWCGHGYGHPFYGLYNLDELERKGLEFKFDEDIEYFNEGTFLHKLFIEGSVKFVPDVTIRVSTNSKKPDSLTLLKSYTSFTQRTLILFLKSKIKPGVKLSALKIIFRVYSKYEIELFLAALQEVSKKDLILYSLANPLFLILVAPFIPRYAALRLSSARNKLFSITRKISSSG